MYKHVLLIYLCSFIWMGFAQTNDCDLVKLNRLSEIFQSTESTNTKLVYDDPNDPRFGTLIDTSQT